jgi:hypothetical protein
MVRLAGKMGQVQRGSASELLSTTAAGGGDDQRDEPDLVRRAFMGTSALHSKNALKPIWRASHVEWPS